MSFDTRFERGAGVVRPPASPVLRPGLIESGLVSTPARARLRAFVTPAAPRPAPPLGKPKRGPAELLREKSALDLPWAVDPGFDFDQLRPDDS
ncbi:hypothetical protein N8077_04915 [Myxococcota bacterium]|nr:hypothetical protein [Myxococcota bacterium]